MKPPGRRRSSPTRADFTLDDFLAQMQQIRNMGSMKKIS